MTSRPESAESETRPRPIEWGRRKRVSPVISLGKSARKAFNKKKPRTLKNMPAVANQRAPNLSESGPPIGPKMRNPAIRGPLTS